LEIKNLSRVIVMKSKIYEYKGFPVLVLFMPGRHYGSLKAQLRLGYTRCKVILENLDVIRDFVRECDEKGKKNVKPTGKPSSYEFSSEDYQKEK
jgi:hypothetical protein